MGSLLNLVDGVRDEVFYLEQSMRLRAALEAADLRHPGLRNRIEAQLARAHAEAAAVLDGQAVHTDLADIATAWASLRPEVRRLEYKLPAAGIGDWVGYVSADGTLWGLGRYEQLDCGWIEAVIHWLEHYDHPEPFVTNPQIIDIPDQVRIGIVGDWGTGYWSDDSGPKNVCAAMTNDAAYVNIHLGDVYYAGTQSQERDNFVNLWPAGTFGSFALNSNHEMYDGGRGYYQEALHNNNKVFIAQAGCSYFALRNTNWLIIGLDSAYYATGDLCMNGALDATQGAFLGRLMANAGKRRVIMLTHHTGLDLTGTTPTALWHQVTTCLGRVPDVWYWGHAHNGVVYTPFQGCAARCIGHGAIPYGDASMLNGLSSVQWFETQRASNSRAPRVLNGYMRVSLDGPTLAEQAVAEDGSVRWPSP